MLPPSPDEYSQLESLSGLDDPAGDPFFDSPGENALDALGLYLREIRSTPPLTAEEETALFQQIGRGDGDAERARHEIVTRNLHLVVNISKRYAGYGMPLEDVIQEGNIGLMAAARGFDWQRGVRFASYATVAIRGAIITALTNRAHTIRVPKHAYKKMGGTVREPLSLDTPLNEDGGVTLGESITDENGASPFEAAASRALTKRIAETLGTLTPREAAVLRMRFGLDGDVEYTLEMAAAQIGLTHERARQIEAKALRKLRHPRRSYLLQSFYSHFSYTRKERFTNVA
ncbi:MAG TPA: RNA polymerase sigma factor RpoD/SigA [Bryobacteraceae bacterium]|nr:RNA polymerase sigma factor RpoD/SigA [Bryobacteraceae bacterium]